MKQGKQYFRARGFRLSDEVYLEIKKLHLSTGLSHDLLFKKIIEDYTGNEIKKNK